MYRPHVYDVVDETELRAMVAASGSAELVTVGPDGYPVATLLPVVWAGDTVVAHLARANPQWQQWGDGARALLICAGADAYVSPSWYASKVEHGRVVPTWNYSSVHLLGTVRAHDDPAWTRHAVTRLTEQHERGRDRPWAVSDAPERYVQGQLRAIVGVEFTIERVEGKAKLSQNRSDADRRGVVAGLRAGDDRRGHVVADAMQRGPGDDQGAR